MRFDLAAGKAKRTPPLVGVWGLMVNLIDCTTLRAERMSNHSLNRTSLSISTQHGSIRVVNGLLKNSQHQRINSLHDAIR